MEPPSVDPPRSDDGPASLLIKLGSISLEVPQTGIVMDARMRLHVDPEDDHPECPERLIYIEDAINEAGLLSKCKRIPGRNATDGELTLVHTERHVEHMHLLQDKDLMTKEKLAQVAFEYNSIYINEHSIDCALFAAGSVVELTSQVLKGQVRNGIAIVRPPGHHAEAHCAMGFCFFNNVAVAAAVATRQLGVQRLLIVDWDVHHGNGTQKMFENDPRVMFVSLHRYDHGGFYPGGRLGAPDSVGKGEGAGYSMNVGWNAGGVGDNDYACAFERLILPVAREFSPELVIISSGFDAARGDPLGGCDVTPAGYAHMTRELCQLAQGRVIVALEGGYDLQAISMSAVAVTHVLLEETELIKEKFDTSKVKANLARADAVRDIEATMAAMSNFWKCVMVPKRVSARIAQQTDTPRSSPGHRSSAPSSASSRRNPSPSSSSTNLPPSPSPSSPSSPLAPAPASFSELATCPHVESFHHLDLKSVALYDLQGPVPCGECGSRANSYVCVTCRVVRCGHVGSHASSHAGRHPGHHLFASLTSGSVYCVTCAAGIKDERMLEVKKAVLDKKAKS